MTRENRFLDGICCWEPRTSKTFSCKFIRKATPGDRSKNRSLFSATFRSTTVPAQFVRNFCSVKRSFFTFICFKCQENADTFPFQIFGNHFSFKIHFLLEGFVFPPSSVQRLSFSVSAGFHRFPASLGCSCPWILLFMEAW